MIALHFTGLLLLVMAIIVAASVFVAFCMQGFFGVYFWIKYLILGRW
jgi:hypothetical protein